MADTVPLATPRTTLASSQRLVGVVAAERSPAMPWPDRGGRDAEAEAGGRVAVLLHGLGDAAGPGGATPRGTCAP